MKKLRAFSIVVASLSAVYANAIDINVNSTPIQFSDAMPYQKSGVIMVPVRPILDEMHINLDWNQAENLMTATENDNWIKVKVGSSLIDANGQSLTMESPATWKDGRLYVPIRFFAEALGAQVDWDKATQTANINGRIEVSTGASEIQTANIAPALALESENKAWYEAGDVIEFSLQANQGITPTLYLDGGNAAIPMTEQKPGFYMASYTIPTGQSSQVLLGAEAPYASVPYQGNELFVSLDRSFYSEPIVEYSSIPQIEPGVATDTPLLPDSLVANTNPSYDQEPIVQDPAIQDPYMKDPYQQDPNNPFQQDPSVKDPFREDTSMPQDPYRSVPLEPVPSDPTIIEPVPTEPYLPATPVEPTYEPTYEPPMFLSPSLDADFSYRMIGETLTLSGMAPGARTIRISVRPACHLDGQVESYGFIERVEVPVNADGTFETPEIDIDRVDGKMPGQFIVKMVSVAEDGRESEEIEKILEN